MEADAPQPVKKKSGSRAIIPPECNAIVCYLRLNLSSETVGGATYQNPLTTTKKHDLRLKTTTRKN